VGGTSVVAWECPGRMMTAGRCLHRPAATPDLRVSLALPQHSVPLANLNEHANTLEAGAGKSSVRPKAKPFA